MLLPHFAPCQQGVSAYVSLRALLSCAHIRRHCHARFRCAGALRCDGRRASNWFARASFTSAAESASACCCTAFATQRVRSKVESLRALHQYTSVQRRSALHAAPATLVARPARVESLHSSSHCGRFVVHERRNQFASAYAALRLQLHECQRFSLFILGRIHFWHQMQDSFLACVSSV